jgi:hypothetical protein
VCGDQHVTTGTVEQGANKMRPSRRTCGLGWPPRTCTSRSGRGSRCLASSTTAAPRPAHCTTRRAKGAVSTKGKRRDKNESYQRWGPLKDVFASRGATHLSRSREGVG